MRCPYCKQRLIGIPPLSREEWICVNDECSQQGEEFYGINQKEVNSMKKEILKE